MLLLKVRPRMAALAFPDASPDRSALRTLGAVLGAALAALGHAGGVERAAHGGVAHARQVLDAAAADPHHRGPLQDRESGGEGKSGSVRVDLVGSTFTKKKKTARLTHGDNR